MSQTGFGSVFVKLLETGGGLSATGEGPERRVTVQTAVCVRGGGGLTARLRGLRGHGRHIVDGGRGGQRGALHYCCTCAAKNTRQHNGFY